MVGASWGWLTACKTIAKYKVLFETLTLLCAKNIKNKIYKYKQIKNAKNTTYEKKHTDELETVGVEIEKAVGIEKRGPSTHRLSNFLQTETPSIIYIYVSI